MTEQIPFLITVDVEGAVDAGSYHTVDLLAEMLSNLAFPVTLFVTPDVVRARTSTVEQWLADDHAVGLHIHPERLGGNEVWLGTYDQDSIESFLSQGIDVFESYLGDRPRLFRAGRWSFSRPLLRALAAMDFNYDASHRPTERRELYQSHGLIEFPLSVYGSWLFRSQFFPWDVETLPLSIDALLGSTPRSLACYAATWRILASNPSYLMVGFHDYDLSPSSMRRRIERYLTRVNEFTDSVSLDEMAIRPVEQNY
jgi:peptidoglycan/xylan/chitin deacetylase (PgdA/CDA1 family)